MSGVQSFSRAMDILDCFTRREPKLSLHDITVRTGLPKSTAHRLLTALKQERLIEQPKANGSYILGFKLFELGSVVLDRLELNRVGSPIMCRLQQSCGEAVHLCMFNGLQPVMIAQNQMVVDPPNQVTTLSSAPAYCTGVGKAILAFQDEATIAGVIADGLERFTPYTMTDEHQLRAELAAIKQRGYAIDDREHQIAVRCVAAPIRMPSGVVFAGISISTLAERLPADRVPPLAELVIGAAAHIEDKLKFRL
jgi:DNA-binding IclR family transcriptional regulator